MAKAIPVPMPLATLSIAIPIATPSTMPRTMGEAFLALIRAS